MGSRYLVRIISCADGDYSIALRGNSVVLALRDPHDRFQIWFKDERYGGTKRDAEGLPAFALINEATDQAMMLDGARCLFAKLCDHPEEPTLWTSRNTDQGGSMCIRWMNDPSLMVSVSKDQFLDGSVIHLWSGDSRKYQRWKIVPQEVPVQLYATHSVYLSQPAVTISCKIREGYNLTICNDAVMLAPSNLRDKNQHWIKETTCARHAKDQDNRRAFALVNKATGQAIKHGFGKGHLVRLAPFNPYHLDASILWTEGDDLGHGFRHIRMIHHTNWVFDLIGGGIGLILLGLWEICGRDNYVQYWKIEEV